ncbi:MAG: HAD hydrolase family protein [Oscillospiraceae bacterium]|nr:HAD hydrolase family protein [Oscillospiraceae bacterium]
MKNLYISDMDGTLLQSNGVLSDYAKQKINEFYEKGVLFSVATARSMVTATPLLQDVRFSVPIVLMNGVFVYDTERKIAVKYHEIAESAIDKILNAFLQYGMHPFMFLYGDDGNLSIKCAEFDNDGMRKFYDYRKNMLRWLFCEIENFSHITKGQHPVYINYFAPYEQLKPVIDILETVEHISFAFYKDSYSDDWLVEIYSADASKANAARDTADFVKADGITAFGDNLNDIIMLNSADRAVAVSNAVEDVKNIADIIIGDNNSDSVVKFIAEENGIEI